MSETAAAAGAWHGTAKNSWHNSNVPKDGTRIIGYWPGTGFRVARWNEDAIFGAWDCGYMPCDNHCVQCGDLRMLELDDPIVWAELYWDNQDRIHFGIDPEAI